MYNKKELSKNFWNNVDKLRGKISLKELCNETSIKYKRIQDQRMLGGIPNLTDGIAIAKFLNTDVNYLLYNEKNEYLPLFYKLKENKELYDICEDLTMLNPTQINVVKNLIDSYLINGDISMEKKA